MLKNNNIYIFIYGWSGFAMTEYGFCDEKYMDWYSGKWIYSDLTSLVVWDWFGSQLVQWLSDLIWWLVSILGLNDGSGSSLKIWWNMA